MEDHLEELKMKLIRARDTVADEKTFLEFVAALAADWHMEREIESVKPSSPYGPGAMGWENGNIGAFLDAARTWGEASTDGLRFYEVPANIWRRVADMLYAGKIYE